MKVTYHSYEWACLVNSGWITMYVDDKNIATMINEWTYIYE